MSTTTTNLDLPILADGEIPTASDWNTLVAKLDAALAPKSVIVDPTKIEPVTYTQNLGLPQWSKRSLMKMDDFNAANAKLDAAYAGLDTKIDDHTGWMKFSSFTAEESAAYINLDVSGIDWSQYREMMMRVVTAGDVGIFLYPNDSSTSTSIQWVMGNSSSSSGLAQFYHPDYPCWIRFIAARDPDAHIITLYHAGTHIGGGYERSTLTYRQLHTLQLRCNVSSNVIAAGLTADIWLLR